MFYKLINSECDLYNKIVKYSLENTSTTIGENVRYFKHKYNITDQDWYKSLNYIYNIMDKHVNNYIECDTECKASVIIELCDSRDNDLDNTQVFTRGELKYIIDLLCIE